MAEKSGLGIVEIVLHVLCAVSNRELKVYT